MSAAALPFTPLSVLAGAIQLESLIITPDTMPHHYVARAWILDLQPSQMVAAIVAVEDEIRKTYPHMHRSGWRAASDGLRIYFYAWTWPPASVTAGQVA